VYAVVLEPLKTNRYSYAVSKPERQVSLPPTELIAAAAQDLCLPDVTDEAQWTRIDRLEWDTDAYYEPIRVHASPERQLHY
jgi:hypothetical protein